MPGSSDDAYINSAGPNVTTATGSVNAIRVGSGAAGQLFIQNGGKVSSNDSIIAYFSLSSGDVTVDGTGSLWQTAGLTVARFGAGSLTIRSGGHVNSTSGRLGGIDNGANATVIVTGPGSQWTTDNGMKLGDGGNASLQIMNGGKVVIPTDSLKIAIQSSSTGILIIGAAAIDPAASPGELEAKLVSFGSGTGTIVFNHTGTAYVFTPDIAGNGTLTFLAGNTLLAGDLSGFTGSGSIAPGANMTTAAAQEAFLSSLSDDANAAMIESRAIGQQLLGANRPMTEQSYGYAEAMYGSAQGLVGGQYAMGDFALIGGAAYGTQDRDGIEQDEATTLALAGRYMLGDGAVRPFVELGGWVTPDGTLSLQRDYLINGLPNGPAGDTDTGRGVAEAQSWAAYGRYGLMMAIAGRHQFVGYGEIGRQSLSYDGYTESTGLFPARVQDGDMSFNVGRFGGSYTHDLGNLLPIPAAVTLSGAVARSFGTEGSMDADVYGVRFSSGAGQNTSWGEYGARLHLRASDDVSLSMGVTGTTAWDMNDTALHGFVGVSYRF